MLAYLLSLLDLSGVSLFMQPSPGLTILVCFLPVTTEPLFFFAVYVQMARMCQPHAIVSHNL